MRELKKKKTHISLNRSKMLELWAQLNVLACILSPDMQEEELPQGKLKTAHHKALHAYMLLDNELKGVD